MKQLYESLRQAGLEPVVLGERILVLPFGGRVLGVYPDRQRNAYWTNPMLLDAEALRAHLATDEWTNFGGDRTWISPEMELFVADLDRFWETYRMPRVIDPADYRVTQRADDAVTVVTPLKLHFMQLDCHLELELTKTVRCLDQPPLDVPDGVAYVGYECSSALEAKSGLTTETHPGVWHIIQVPGGGRIIVPTTRWAEVRTLIGKPEVTRAEREVSCAVRTAEGYKFAVHVADSTGWIMHHRPHSEGQADLIVRRFRVKPDALYGDWPVDDATVRGYAVQVYVDDGTYGGFGELEYHSPAIDARQGATRIEDSSEAWSFRGPAQAVASLARQVALA